MQYGNFFENENIRPQSFRFKSYYVVWKPKVFPPGKTEFIRFKSYYVVWKPSRKHALADQYNMFKSYYVVWKLSSSFFFARASVSLNRTMQYGNCSITSKDNCAFSKFKSYYVVWKPRFVAKNPKIVGSLNRTMQYGNEVRKKYPDNVEPV